MLRFRTQAKWRNDMYGCSSFQKPAMLLQNAWKTFTCGNNLDFSYITAAERLGIAHLLFRTIIDQFRSATNAPSALFPVNDW